MEYTDIYRWFTGIVQIWTFHSSLVYFNMQSVVYSYTLRNISGLSSPFSICMISIMWCWLIYNSPNHGHWTQVRRMGSDRFCPIERSLETASIHFKLVVQLARLISQFYINQFLGMSLCLFASRRSAVEMTKGFNP